MMMQMKNYFETIEEDEDLHKIEKIHPVPSMSTDENHPFGIIIDNGSYHCRAGWSSMDEPVLNFRPLCAKLKASEIKNLDFVSDDDKLVLHNGGYLVGNDLHPFDYLRYNARSPFDNDLVTSFEYFEQVMDYIFYKLGFSTASDISLKDIPLVMTESILNPAFTRQSTLEILFECYGIPAINLSIDALLSLHQSCTEKSLNYSNVNSLIIRSGFHSTHVIPILNGTVQWNSCKRLNLGGFHATDLLLKTMQLKYPNIGTDSKYFIPIYDVLGIPSLSVTKAEFLKVNYCQVSDDYHSVLQKLSEDKEFYENSTVRIFNNKLQYEEFLKAKEAAAQLTAETKPDEHPIPEFKNLSECEKWLETKRNELAQLQFKLQKMQFELSSQSKDHTLKSKRSAASKQRQKSKIAAEIHDAEDETFDDWSLYDTDKKKKKKKKKSSTKEEVVDAKKVKKATSEVNDLTNLIHKVEMKHFGEKRTDYVKSHFISQYKKSKNMSDNTGLRLTVERIRIPEIVFQPLIAGRDQIGLAEILENTLQEFSKEQQAELISNVFVCGGNTLFKGFNTRLENEIRKISPSGSLINVTGESNHENSAWMGGKSLLINNYNNSTYWMKLDEYQEQGAERLIFKQHPMSNIS